MTDKQTLFKYRMKQAEETLADAEKMLQSNLSPRSIINRSYYSMFYTILALFLVSDINANTSKHAGIITLFNKEFVHTGKLDKKYTIMLQKLFEKRLIGDYKDFVEVTKEDAEKSVQMAKEFIQGIKDFIDKNS